MRGALLLLGLAALMAACAARSVPEDDMWITINGVPLVTEEQMERASAGGLDGDSLKLVLPEVRGGPRRRMQGVVRPSVQDGWNAQKGRYPYYSSIRSGQDEHFCGGTLINYGTRGAPGALSAKIVLTAAHCFEDDNNPGGLLGQPWSVLTNPQVFINPYANKDVWDSNGFTQDNFPLGNNTIADYVDKTVYRTAYGVWMHPSYQYTRNTTDPQFRPNLPQVVASMEHDIALVFLDAGVGPPGTGNNLGATPTILLAEETAKPGAPTAFIPANTTLRLIGMGLLSEVPEIEPDFLQQGNQQVQSVAACTATTQVDTPAVNPFTSNVQFCAGTDDRTWQGACRGDSGGPLFQGLNSWVLDRQHGVVSWGRNGNNPCNEAPTVYASTAATRNWLLWQINKFEKEYFEYTMDIFVKINSQAAPTNFNVNPPTIPVDSWYDLASFISDDTVGKTLRDSTDTYKQFSPMHVNFYSYNPSSGRIRFKWTSRKRWEHTWPYMFTGFYGPSSALPTVAYTCTAGASCATNFNRGNRYDKGDCSCTSGPFSSTANRTTQGITATYAGITNLFYQAILRDTYNNANQQANVGPQSFKPSFRVQRIVLSNGYVKRRPTSTPFQCNNLSDAQACQRDCQLFPAIAQDCNAFTYPL